VEWRYDGIDVDYEDLEANDRDAYSTFLRELAAAVHAAGKILTSTVHPKVSDAATTDATPRRTSVPSAWRSTKSG
jgi:spore germination protein YaaH